MTSRPVGQEGHCFLVDAKLTPNHGKRDCDVKRNYMTSKNLHQTAVNTIVTSQEQILTQ